MRGQRCTAALGSPPGARRAAERGGRASLGAGGGGPHGARARAAAVRGQVRLAARRARGPRRRGRARALGRSLLHGAGGR